MWGGTAGVGHCPFKGGGARPVGAGKRRVAPAAHVVPRGAAAGVGIPPCPALQTPPWGPGSPPCPVTDTPPRRVPGDPVSSATPTPTPPWGLGSPLRVQRPHPGTHGSDLPHPPTPSRTVPGGVTTCPGRPGVAWRRRGGHFRGCPPCTGPVGATVTRLRGTLRGHPSPVGVRVPPPQVPGMPVSPPDSAGLPWVSLTHTHGCLPPRAAPWVPPPTHPPLAGSQLPPPPTPPPHPPPFSRC